MRAIYSIGVRFAAGGIGNIAYHAVRGLQRNEMLFWLLCGSYQPTEIPERQIRAMGAASRVMRRLAIYGSFSRLNHMHNLLFDRWATRHIEPSELFHGWGGFCLDSLHRAKSMGAITIVERASSHPAYQTRLLQEEFDRWRLRYRAPNGVLQRALAEISTADYILIPSDFVRRSFLAEGVSEERLIQVPFGVESSIFRPLTTPRPASPFRVLFVGQIDVRKGILDLIEAWKMLQWQEAELCIVGRISPDLRQVLAQYADSASIRFMGHIRDPVSAFQQSDVFVFPTIEEGSALVVYEAMACGLPVVTTPNAGSVIRDGQEGFIVPIRDIEGVAGRLEDLRSDDDLRRKMGIAARARVENFTWTNYGNALAEALFAKVRSAN